MFKRILGRLERLNPARSPMDIKKYTEANREAWNEVAPLHQKARKIDLKAEFRKAGFSTLDEFETRKLRELGIEGKRVAQLCCNNGRETLSLVSLGATSAVGFDISDAAIEEARKLAEISGLDCSFVRTDVYDIGDEYSDEFDLVYITIGSLYWLPDLDRFFGIVSRILTEDGTLMLYDSHPFLNMFETPGDPGYDHGNPLKVVYPYFKKDPWTDTSGLDYLGGIQYEGKENYGFPHTLSEVFNAIVRSGIQIVELTEYPHDVSVCYKHLEPKGELPLSYILIGRKRG
jgi:SAM-dependent methyltransferase